MENFFIDLHCHPSMKPYGQSFTKDPGKQSAISSDKYSLWYYNPPDLLAKAIQLFTGISKFTQADGSSLCYGRVQIVFASLYPIERGFFRNKLGTGIISDLADSFVTGVSNARVDAIQGISNYYEDLNKEYQFILQCAGLPISNHTGTYTYQLVKNQADLHAKMQEVKDHNTVFFIFSIEGMHVLNTKIDGAPDPDNFLENVNAIKNWGYTPFFITFSHHFYNHLCGHARSLFQLVGSETDQEEGIDTGFTPLGYRVLDALLSRQNGKRIFIDIKHMSAIGRQQYFSYLDQKYKDEAIPIIMSHAAANGLRSMNEKVVDIKETGYKLLPNDINFYDEEFVRVASSKGIIGLQLDERRLANSSTLMNIKHSIFLNKIRHYRAELVWNQIQHIVEVLDQHELFAWDVVSVGSDFEGIINPLNGYLTEEAIPDLMSYLERYAFNYMNDRGKKVLNSYNQIEPAEIVNRIFFSNAFAFITEWME
jgi:Zn-dependent dipeptidase, microsomal dipeptidase homolog